MLTADREFEAPDLDCQSCQWQSYQELRDIAKLGVIRGVTRGQGGAIPRTPSQYGGAQVTEEHRMAAGGQKSPNNVTKTSVSNMGAPNLLLAPGAI